MKYATGKVHFVSRRPDWRLQSRGGGAPGDSRSPAAGGSCRRCENEPVWIHTASINGDAEQFADFDGIWCVPASPYANEDGTIAAIRFARENGVPFLGTCAGFQHALIEYARNVCGIPSASHQETAPDADQLLITRLACSLVEQSEELTLAPSGILRLAYGVDRITEGYHCNFGLNPEFEPLILANGFHAAARNRTRTIAGGGTDHASILCGHSFPT